MLYLIPILGALASAVTIVMQKVVLRKKKIDAKLFQTSAFLAAVIVMIPLLYFLWALKPQAFESSNLFIFLLVIVFSMIANLAMFYSMKHEKVNELEPAFVLEPLFTILLAILFSFFFTNGLYERNLNVIVPAIIAGLTLVLTHVRRHHLDFNRYFLAAIAGSFFFGLELVLTRLILEFYSPMTFYFLRCVSLFVLGWIIFKPDFSKVETPARWQILLIGGLWVAFRVLVYYGYIYLGVIFTTLIVMLSPVFVFLFAWKFLGEKLEMRNIIAAIVIVGCVLYATLG